MSTGSVVEQQLGYGSAVGFASAIIVSALTLLYFYASRRLNQVY
ncbi:hypothetical protein [Paenibacillus sp.]|nr:hypothetical protein [Paenibacillus sp.]